MAPNPPAYCRVPPLLLDLVEALEWAIAVVGPEAAFVYANPAARIDAKLASDRAMGPGVPAPM